MEPRSPSDAGDARAPEPGSGRVHAASDPCLAASLGFPVAQPAELGQIALQSRHHGVDGYRGEHRQVIRRHREQLQVPYPGAPAVVARKITAFDVRRRLDQQRRGRAGAWCAVDRQLLVQFVEDEGAIFQFRSATRRSTPR